jgi:hypothetical protein
MEWIPSLYQHPRRKRWGSLPGTIEVLEERQLLADGIAPLPGPTIMGSPGVPLTNVVVATFTITDSSGSPGSKWRSEIIWGDGQIDKLVSPTPGPNGSFEFLGNHTYATANTFQITVMIAVPGSHLPNDNTVHTQAIIQPLANASVSGTVFNDTSGQVGLPGWTVQLLSGSTVVSSAVSGSDGSYTISNIAPGNYTLAEVVQPGFIQTAPPPPGTYALTIASGQTITGKDFGNIVAPLQSIAVTPANPTVTQGIQQQFVATGTYADDSMKDITGQVTWSSSNTTVASINSAGLASALAPGMSTISAALSGVTGSTTLTVSPATLKSIAVSPANPAITKGTQQQFTATGTLSDNTTEDLTNQVTWASANTTVATITSTGLASALTPGTSDISATFNGVTGSTTLTVNPAALKSIALSPANPTIVQGTQQQFTATGTFSDNTTADLTNQVTWTSASPSVAVVSNTGLATGVKQGTSTISAALDGVSSSTTLTVGPPLIVRGLRIQARLLKTYTGFVAYFKRPNTKTQDFHAQINWGDNSLPKSGHIHGLGDSHFAVIGSHRYIKPGIYTITVTVRDPTGFKVPTTTLVHVVHGDNRQTHMT